MSMLPFLHEGFDTEGGGGRANSGTLQPGSSAPEKGLPFRILHESVLRELCSSMVACSGTFVPKHFFFETDRCQCSEAKKIDTKGPAQRGRMRYDQGGREQEKGVQYLRLQRKNVSISNTVFY